MKAQALYITNPSKETLELFRNLRNLHEENKAKIIAKKQLFSKSK